MVWLMNVRVIVETRGDLDLTRIIDEQTTKIDGLEKTLETIIEENNNLKIILEREKQLRLEREKQLNEWKGKYLDG